MNHLHYFAYGSNLLVPRLHARVPSCKVLETARLTGYRLRWHKLGGNDQSGKCNVFMTSEPRDQVVGVVYRINTTEKHLLDEAEGLGHGYSIGTVSVRGTRSDYEAFTYVAVPEAIDESLIPYTWYKSLVLTGAKAHDLPAEYIAGIEAQEAIQDRDDARHALHMGIVSRPYEMADFLL